MTCTSDTIKGIGFCSADFRSDGNSVFFEEVKSLKQEDAKESNMQTSDDESQKEESATEEQVADEQKSVKNDRLDDKLRWELLPLTDIEDIVEVYTFGAKKYGPHTWRGLDDGFERYKAALLRHMVSFEKGEELDEESGLPALAHMAWNAIAMLAIWHDKQKEKQLKKKRKMKKLTLNDLPKEEVEKIRIAIREDEQIVAMIKNRNALLSQYKLAEASAITYKIKQIEDKVLQNLIDDYQVESVRMDKLMLEMTNEDRDEINTLSNGIIMLCDMIETFSMDLNEILHKYHPDFHIEMYEKFKDVGKEAKDQMRFMAQNTNELYQVNFADYADDITKMVKNKAKSLVRKLREKGQGYKGY